MNSSKRNISFDILRIISAISIIIMHITADRFDAFNIGSKEWTANAAINSLFHFGVPIFVMISGALFLDPQKEINIKRLYTHNILRLAIILFVWNAFYGIYDYMQYKASAKYIVWEIADGRNHLWFIPMIIGLYILQPILLRWVKASSKTDFVYFISAFIIIQILWAGTEALEFSEFVTFLSKYRNIPLFCSYVGYFVIGCFIVHIGLSPLVKKLIYICGAICMVISPIFTVLYSEFRNIPVYATVDSFSLLTFLYSIALFCLIHDLFAKKEVSAKSAKLVSNIGKDTLGLYLCHIALIEIITPLYDWYHSVPVLLGVWVYTISLFVMGICISAVLRRIPIIGRYIC